MAKSITFVSGHDRNARVDHGGHTDRLLPRALKLPPTLSPAPELRLRGVEYERATTVASVTVVFHRSRATVYRWLRRYDPHKLRTLEPCSRRSRYTPRRQWTAAQEQAVLTLRARFPRCGKAKLQVLLTRQGIVLSESSIGRIIASLRRRGWLIEPRAVRVRHPKLARPHATRVLQEKRYPTVPG